MSWLRLTATAGVTAHFPRRDSMTAAAAPGWPSMREYAARIARRLNQNVPASRPIGMAMSTAVNQLMKIETGTAITMIVASTMPRTSAHKNL